MWWPFKKKTFEKKMEGKLTLSYRSEEIDVGKTYINFLFDDGRTCSTAVYGQFSQQYAQGYRSSRDRNWVEAYAHTPFFPSSYDNASAVLSSMSVSGAVSIPNDSKKISSITVGNIHRASIGDTEVYKETHIVAYVVEK